MSRYRDPQPQVVKITDMCLILDQTFTNLDDETFPKKCNLIGNKTDYKQQLSLLAGKGLTYQPRLQPFSTISLFFKQHNLKKEAFILLH